MRNILIGCVVFICSLGYFMLHYVAFALGDSREIDDNEVVPDSIVFADSIVTAQRKECEFVKNDLAVTVMDTGISEVNTIVSSIKMRSLTLEDVIFLFEELKYLKRIVYALAFKTQQEINAIDEALSVLDRRVTKLEKTCNK